MKEKIELDIFPAREPKDSQGEIAVVVFNATTISDAEGISSASIRIKDYVAEHKPMGMVFDFEKVKFFSSQVLGLLLDIRSRLQEYNGKVVISAIKPQLHRVFTITNLDKIFSFFPDKASAVKSIESC
ncbi:MAG: STAS domain-containing protein [Sedimentisphaerales bacterium]|nr:STAS domain-containing protein [Sedimentisphaerales bacterium]